MMMMNGESEYSVRMMIPEEALRARSGLGELEELGSRAVDPKKTNMVKR